MDAVVLLATIPLGKTDVVRQMYGYRGLDALASFADAITTAKPDLIVPGDDLATQHLHRSLRPRTSEGRLESKNLWVDRRSLGAPEGSPFCMREPN